MKGAPDGTPDPHRIRTVREWKYLGLLWSDDLKWNRHFKEIVLPGCEAVASRLSKHLASYDMLSPATSMMLLRTLMVSKMKFGCAVWATDIHSQRHAPTTRLKKENWDKLEAIFDDSLKLILGLDKHASTVALYRELGWEGLDFVVAKSKVSLLQKRFFCSRRKTMVRGLWHACVWGVIV